MAFDGFMGSPPDPFKEDDNNDGFITITGPDDPPTPNPKMKQFGNTEMAEFKKGTSAMDAVNDPYTQQTFNLGSNPTPAGIASPKKPILGAIDWKSSETLLVGGAFFGMGILASVLFSRYYK